MVESKQAGEMHNYTLNHADGISTFVDSVSARISGDSIDAVKQCISDIDYLIESRRQLNVQIIHNLEKTELEVSNFLSQFNFGTTQQNREQITLFKSKEIEIAEAKRKEQLQCWQDIAKLKEERRGHARELSEREGRMSMLDSILK